MDNEIEVKKSAIDNYSVFSNGQKKILKILVELDAPVPVNIIQNIAQVSRQSFNFSIQGLLKLGFITRKKQRVYIYQINNQMLEEIVSIYKKQKKLTKNTWQYNFYTLY